jgi:hypothetical protein
MLSEELNRLEQEQLVRIAEIWGKKDAVKHDKKNLIKSLKDMVIDEYYLLGVLEKLTPVQVDIFSHMINNKNVLTLGEISRKVKLQPINVEQELAVLKNLMLVYQRKNRERITNNLDKYYPFDEVKKLVSIDTNSKGEKYRYTVEKEIFQNGVQSLDPAYFKIIGKNPNKRASAGAAIKNETLASLINKLADGEISLLDEAFNNGGLIEISAARLIMEEQKLPVQETIRKFHNFHLLRDTYFVDERFVRVLVMPVELFNYLCEFPMFPVDDSIKELQAKVLSNELDFGLNLKKLLLFISHRGLTLSQSRKLKQADMKRSEQSLTKIDMNLFPEKSQLHQIEVILPFLKLLGLIDLRDEDIVLQEDYEEFLSENPMDLNKNLLKMIPEFSDKRMVGEEVFLPIELPFFKTDVFDRCKKALKESNGVFIKVLVAQLVREWVIMVPDFRVRNFRSMYLDKRGQIISAILYMHLLGLLRVEYPKRYVTISNLGEHFFFRNSMRNTNEAGALIINPDASLIAIPEKLTLEGIHLLKSFAALKEHDQVYNFQITKESMQQGMLLANDVEDFINFLEETSKNRVPQNVMFLINDWSKDLPIVSIEERVVLLETSDAALTELLLGQIKGKKIVRKELSPTALIIQKNRVTEVMDIAEKLEMIVKLTR